MWDNMTNRRIGRLDNRIHKLENKIEELVVYFDLIYAERPGKWKKEYIKNPKETK
jgi:hypothetical protein